MYCQTVNLALMPYAQAHVNIYPVSGTRVLVSYKTTVAELTDDGWLYVRGLYSRTTGRHITAFIKEYVPWIDQPYQIAKSLVKHGFAMNVNTGEVKEISTNA